MSDSFQIKWPITILALISSIVALSADALAQGATAPPNVKPALTLHLAPVEPAVKAGSKALVDVTLENVSGHNIKSLGSLGDEGFLYPMNVWDEKGTTVPETKYGRLKHGHKTAEDPPEYDYTAEGRVVFLRLDPGMSVTNRVCVSKEYDVSKPGKYTIQIEAYDDESQTSVKSNKITVTVTP